MEILHVYLRGGQTVKMEAEKFYVTHTATGLVTRFRWDGTVRPEPLTFSPEAIDFVTIQPK